MTDYLDISVPLSPDMLTWSSHEPVSFEHSEHDTAGANVHVTALHMGSHSGTHVDSPYHFSVGAQTADQLSLDALIGPARVCDFRGATAITAAALETAIPGNVRRVLLKTGNSSWIRTGPMPAMWSHLTADAAAYLVERGVALVGTDGLTVDGPGSSDAHLTLLGAGVIIVETLDLSAVEPGDYHLICLPLRIAGGDGAPARALLRRRHA
ncbi:MAG: cyclase family protein [Armatimonadota bacterium]